MQKGSGFILRSASSQTLAVSPAINYLVDLCPNLWCNNCKAIFFLAGFFFDFSILFPEKACFLTALCGNVAALTSFAPKYTVQNPLWKRHICPAIINVMMENSLSHKSGANSTLYKVSTKVFPLLSHICIRTKHVFLPLRDVCPQLKWIYPYPLMILEWSP